MNKYVPLSVGGLLIIALAHVLGPLQAAEDKTSLWKVRSSSNTVYLLGSIHLLSDDDYPLDQKVETAFEDSDIIVFEVEPDSLETPAVQSYVLANSMYSEGKTLQSELGDSVYGLAKAKAGSLGINLDMFNTLKPWSVALTLTILQMQQLGFNYETGIEIQFWEKAKSAGKTTYGLETAFYQMDLLIKLGDEQQETLLVQTLSQLSDIEKLFTEIVRGWKSGDLTVLENTFNKSFADYPDIYDRLIVQRNVRWVEQIEKFLEEDRNYLVIVGVGHMPGDQGLIRLLEKRGYEVEQP